MKRNRLTHITQLLKPDILAKNFGVELATFLSWRERFRMPYVKIGHIIRIPEPQFLRWIERKHLHNADTGCQQPTEPVLKTL